MNKNNDIELLTTDNMNYYKHIREIERLLLDLDTGNYDDCAKYIGKINDILLNNIPNTSTLYIVGRNDRIFKNRCPLIFTQQEFVELVDTGVEIDKISYQSMSVPKFCVVKDIIRNHTWNLMIMLKKHGNVRIVDDDLHLFALKYIHFMQ